MAEHAYESKCDHTTWNLSVLSMLDHSDAKITNKNSQQTQTSYWAGTPGMALNIDTQACSDTNYAGERRQMIARKLDNQKPVTKTPKTVSSEVASALAPT